MNLAVTTYRLYVLAIMKQTVDRLQKMPMFGYFPSRMHQRLVICDQATCIHKFIKLLEYGLPKATAVEYNTKKKGQNSVTCEHLFKYSVAVLSVAVHFYLYAVIALYPGYTKPVHTML